MNKFKLFLHTLTHFHRKDSYEFSGKTKYHFCLDCDYGNNDFTRTLKKIRNGEFNSPVTPPEWSCSLCGAAAYYRCNGKAFCDQHWNPS